MQLVEKALFIKCLAVLLVGLSLPGCGGGSDGVTVNGQVTFQGQPVSDAGLTFFPETGRPVAVSLTDDGRYTATLQPGNYLATITLGTKLPPGFKEGQPLPPPKFVLPEQYTIQAKSTLTATVAPDQSEPIDFALK